MAAELKIKNTFFDIEEETHVIQSRRSSSLPRSWKPSTLALDSPRDKICRWSDVSTVDSDDCSSVTDQEALSGSFSSCGGDEAPSELADESQYRAVLCLDEAISADERLRLTKLSSKARLFEPASSLPMDMRLVLMAARTALCAFPHIANVQLSEGMVGGVATLVATYRRGSLSVLELASIMAAVKMALLDAASNSSNTYVLGYLNEPFADTGNSMTSATLSSVSSTYEDSTCWDTYQNGYCPRRSTCRWCHPDDATSLKVVISLTEVEH